jgi:hypothetical protein
MSHSMRRYVTHRIGSRDLHNDGVQRSTLNNIQVGVEDINAKTIDDNIRDMLEDEDSDDTVERKRLTLAEESTKTDLKTKEGKKK